MDMNSGGGIKEEPYEKIYIEAENTEEACLIFFNRFGHSPHRVTCTCCGEDYTVDTSDTLAEESAYDRGCRCVQTADGGWTYLEEADPENRTWPPYCSLEEYCKRDNVLIIAESEISDDERKGGIPSQGYVWMD